MTITALDPLRTDRERALLDVLDRIGQQIDRDGFRPHEYAAQTLARAGRQLTPGAAATLANRASEPIARRHSFQVVSRVLTRCGDEHTHRSLAAMLARYAVSA
jgi:hypothetical protein